MSRVIQVIAPRLLGPALMVAAALIVKGYTDMGDGFSAGVVVALAVALQYIALGAPAVEASLPALRHAPRLAVAGLLAAIAVGFLPVAFGDPPFTHYPPPGESPVAVGSLELITAVAFDVGLFVLVASVLVMLVHQLALLVGDSEETSLAFALTAATMFGTGAYLLLSRDLVRVVVGVVLVSQSAVLTLIATGLTRGRAPIYPLPDGEISDPLTQAMALTAIVIGLAMTALLLALVYRVAVAFRTRELEDVAKEEAEHEESLDRADLSERESEEAAAR